VKDLEHKVSKISEESPEYFSVKANSNFFSFNIFITVASLSWITSVTSNPRSANSTKHNTDPKGSQAFAEPSKQSNWFEFLFNVWTART
jgi:hypothetical protein